MVSIVNRIIYTFVLSALFISAGYAGKPMDNGQEMLTKHWGDGKWRFCAGHNIPSDACIGTMKDECHLLPSMDTSKDKECKFTSFPSSYVYARDFTDEAAIRMLIATEINANGAKFCPIQIESKNRNKNHNTWTEYAYVSNTDCVWLCKVGHTGVGCTVDTSNEASVTTCDPTLLTRANYQNIPRVASGANIEDSVAMFLGNQYKSCGLNDNQEHDIVLGVVGWLESGHGAWVQPLQVYAQRTCWKAKISWAAIVPLEGGKRTLVCKDGYKPNEKNDDCVPIKDDICYNAKCKSPEDCLCPGWDKYNATDHVYKREGDCYQYRCKEDNHGFEKDTTDHKCVDCGTGMRYGLNTENGECVKCEEEMAFDKEKPTICKSTTKLTKTDLKYGKDITKNTVKEAGSSNYGACWEIVEASVYSDCVLNSGLKTTENN